VDLPGSLCFAIHTTATISTTIEARPAPRFCKLLNSGALDLITTGGHLHLRQRVARLKAVLVRQVNHERLSVIPPQWRNVRGPPWCFSARQIHVCFLKLTQGSIHIGRVRCHGTGGSRHQHILS
jgi:hypothetical protein